MEPKLSTKNTKTEILDAYEALLKEVQQAKSDVPKHVQEEKQKKEILSKVSDVTNESIVKSIVTLKSELGKALDELQIDIEREYKKLEDIRSAITIEKQSLEDLYSLSANTDSLAAMLLVQKEKKESFEKEMQEKEKAFTADMTLKKEQWELKKMKQQAEEKEYVDELLKRRKREEDEYTYGLKIKRKKEEDEYESKKIQLEKELTERKEKFEHEVATREQVLKNAETELNELRKLNVGFPTKLDKALKDKETEITKQLQTKYEFDIKLIEKQNEIDIRLKDQMISSLQEKITELQTQMRDYAEKANRAEGNVKDIAVKAIESSSKVHMFAGKSEREDNLK